MPVVSIRRSAYLRGAVVKLRQADAQALLSFLVEVGDMEFDEPYPIDFFTRLRDLVPCAAVTYQVADVNARHFDLIVGIGPGDDDVDDGVDDDHYWSLGPCPISDYRVRTGSLSPIRVTDVIGSRRYHELPLYREYFHAAGVDHMIDVGLPGPRGRLRSLVLFREIGSHDFSERERSVLEMLQPHLRRLEATAALRRRLLDGFRRQAQDPACEAYARLTAREREVLELVAEGKTNAQIAAELWVSPGTVKKHLEHVYEKSGSRGRTAAARLAPMAYRLAD